MRYTLIESAISLEVTGKDAGRYLNSRLTNDIKGMKPGGACLAAALNVQGRTQGYFTVLCVEESRFLLLCDGGDLSKVSAAVKQFIVADRVTIWNKFRGWRLLHCYDPPARALIEELQIELPCEAPECACIQGKENFWVRRSRSPSPGWDLILPETSEPAVLSSFAARGGTAVSHEERRLLRLRAGIPSFPEELNEDSLLAESGMQKAVSSTKGCYVGQEVMSKIESVGKLPRRLCLLSLEGKREVPPESPVFLGDTAIGKVLTSVRDEENSQDLFFAYLKQVPALAPDSLPFVLGQRAKIVKEAGI